MKKNSMNNSESTSSINNSTRQDRIDLIQRAKQRLSEIREKKNSVLESKNNIDEDDPLGIKKQTSYAPQPLNFSLKKLSPPTEFNDKDSKPATVSFVPEAGISIKKDNNFPQLKKRFSKFQSRSFLNKRLGRDAASAAETGTSILGGNIISSPIESVSNSNQDVNRSSYKLKNRKSELNLNNNNDNDNKDKEKFEKKKYKVRHLDNVKEVLKSAIEDDIKKEQSVEYESPEEKVIFQLINSSNESTGKDIEIKKWDHLLPRIKKSEKELLYDPTSWHITSTDTWYGDGNNFRRPVLEGLYVPDLPYVTASNKRKMEARIHQEEENLGYDWFDSLGRLGSLPNPIIKKSRHHPQLWIEQDSEVPKDNGFVFDTYWPKPLSKYQEIENGRPYLLVMQLFAVDFIDHRLMAPEMVLAKQIEILMKLFEERKKEGITDYLERKVEMLRNTYEMDKLKIYENYDKIPDGLNDEIIQNARKKNEEEFDGIYQAKVVPSIYQQKMKSNYYKDKETLYNEEVEKLWNTLNELRQTKLLRDTESQMDQIIQFRILQMWDRIKKMRNSQGYICTNVHLQISTNESNYDEDVKKLKDEINIELEEENEWFNFNKYMKTKQQSNGNNNSNNEEQDDNNDERRSRRRSRNKSSRSRSLSLSYRNRSLSRHSSFSKRSSSIDQYSDNQNKKRYKHAKDVYSIANFTFDSKTIKKNRLSESDLKKIKSNIQKRLKVSRRKPGAPFIFLKLLKTQEITPTLECPKREQLRRRECESTKFYIKLFYNYKEVTKTTPRPLNYSKFSVPFKTSEIKHAYVQNEYGIFEPRVIEQEKDSIVIGIHITEIPDSIVLKLYECGVVGDKCIADIFVAIPDSSSHIGSISKEKTIVEFSGESLANIPQIKTLDEDSPAIISSLNDDIEHMSYENRNIRGTLHLCVAWGVDEEGRSLGPTSSMILKSKQGYNLTGLGYGDRSSDPTNTACPIGIVNLKQLIKWISTINIDPNDPRNVKLMQLYETIKDELMEPWCNKDFFRLDIPKITFEKTLGVGQNVQVQVKRRELLHLRNTGQVIVQEPIPFWDDDVAKINWILVSDKKAKTLLDRQKQMISDSKNNNNSFNIDSIDSLSDVTMNNFVKRIRTHQLLFNAVCSRPPMLSDFVHEESLYKEIKEKLSFKWLFTQRRPLYPVRIKRDDLAVLQPEKCTLITHIIRGFNIPVRKENYDKNKKVKSPHTYVEVSFQRQKARTTVFDGTNPTWKETIELPFNAPNNDFQPSSLLENDILMENIYLNLYDEYIVDLIEDDRERERNVHHRKERNWLGSVVIPFAHVYKRAKVEGYFRVKTPYRLLDYEQSDEGSSVTNIDRVGTINGCMIHIFITLEPLLIQPPPLRMKFISEEDSRLLKYSKKWVNSGFKNRYCISTTLNLNGSTVFLCRYIRPLQPPPKFDTELKAHRFVSMIPYLNDYSTLMANCQLLCTCDELLEIGAGDEFEHAILLCCYFLFLGLDAYIVVGIGIPEGYTAYVMTRRKAHRGVPSMPDLKSSSSRIMSSLNSVMSLMPKPNLDALNARMPCDWKFYNAVTGETFHTWDAHCPLKEVGCVFNNENIWSNMNKQTDPARMEWNILNTKFWRPFFNKKFPKPADLSSIQPEALHYKEPTYDIYVLEKAIHQVVTMNFEKWRTRWATIWNRHVSRLLHSLLRKLEEGKMEGKDLSKNWLKSIEGEEMKRLKKIYEISGVPINLSLTDFGPIIEAVHATSIHENLENSVEFALAVYCTNYPNNIVSVWIFIASLKEKNRDY
ncbi:hypothetical protein BCR32DRAFT_292732 [Anaeromyces robustus]|uniref:C2 domain-containing protein n=1 Tax=Anaeromyces robustus TaxID=1754192 RepID=A0A1Y1X9D2_9FUNG|nr:hypothetical protein BCR32DRAFT_292732 [Anaeromyces robustus]|eukprot:ORX82345.1 hypothetical protein BCR32DRAFT_292732 [Anaeromyces robustus]